MIWVVVASENCATLSSLPKHSHSSVSRQCPCVDGCQFPKEPKPCVLHWCTVPSTTGACHIWDVAFECAVMCCFWLSLPLTNTHIYHIYICMRHKKKFKCIHTYMYLHKICAHMHACMYTYVYLYVCTHRETSACIHTYIHAYVYIDVRFKAGLLKIASLDRAISG